MRFENENMISIQILVTMNLVANFFIMFYMFFIFTEKIYYYRLQPIRFDINNDNNVLNRYTINFRDIFQRVDIPPNDETCAICLEEFDNTTLNVVQIINCSHYYHEDCLKRWLRIRPTCPLCNINIVARFIENMD